MKSKEPFNVIHHVCKMHLLIYIRGLELKYSQLEDEMYYETLNKLFERLGKRIHFNMIKL